MNGFKLGILIEAVDRATAPIRRVSEQIDRATQPVRRLGSSLRGFSDASGMPRLASGLVGVGGAMRGVVDQSTALAGRLSMVASGFGLLAGGGLFAFKTQLLDVAAQFEKFETVLGTIEGSSDKAKTAMDWISDFATTTPYELEQVTDAYVKLRSYGLSPTNGLLRTLGDTSAAMGKPLMQAVEAIADAITGENERLKEYGIKAAKAGSRIVYEYTDAAGKTQRKAVDANNRQLIEATLRSIWNEKYAGSMDKLSATWGGMMSNLSDQWTRFARMIMEAGAFDWLKNELKTLLDTIDEMAANGELKALAEQIGTQLVAALRDLKDAALAFGSWIRETWPQVRAFAETIGGWGNVLKIAAVVIAGPFLASLVALGQAFISLGVAMMTTPVGWVVAGLAAIVAASIALYTNWDWITDKLQAAWSGIKEAFWDLVSSIAAGAARLAALLPSQLGGDIAVRLQAFADAAAVKTGAGDVMARGGQQGDGSRTELVIEGRNLPPNIGVSVRKTTADDVGLDLGWAMGGP